MRKFSVILLITAGLVLVLSCTGCGGSSAGFEDITWVLESYGDSGNPQPVIEDTTVTATFTSEEKQVSGSAGCNGYFGGYEVKDGLSVGMLAHTEMYCMEPEGVMDQETGYLEILGKAESYTVSGDRLEIDCGDKVLVYKAGTDE
jgi:heat shock protein HslJ